MAFNLGSMVALTGNITTLNVASVQPVADIARYIGVAGFRFRDGYYVLVLKQHLMPADFEFDGLTTRSGGRAGLPLATPSADRARKTVQAGMIENYGADGYLDMKRRALRNAQYSGPQRLVKIVTALPNNDSVAPNKQYPAGGGFLQWRLVRPCHFMVAMFVDGKGQATTARGPGGDLSEGAPQRLKNATALRSYLETA